MIFYFTGTGNSFYAAEKIATGQNEKLLSIAEETDKVNFAFTVQENELVGFVFPIYSWGPPQIVLDFIDKLKMTFRGRPYIFSVSICGDDEGAATKILAKTLAKKGLTLNSGFTVRMPNNYIIMFDVDSEELQQKKLLNAEMTLKEINSILAGREDGVFKLIPGFLPFLKTVLIYPLFNKFGRKPSRFRVNDECTRCGICERICPVHSIRLNDKPHWGKECTQCLACLHHCPTRAIQYGKSTVKKGRYLNPHYKR